MSDIAFIVGLNAGNVNDDVQRGHGWKRMSATSWEDDNGYLVIYLNHPRQLDGVPYGTLVYLAAGYDQRDDWWKLDDAMRRQECDRMELV